MEKTVVFRDFEDRDIDFIYKWKNDEELNKMTVGQFHPFTYKEAVKWVRGCMGEHETYKFWAVCKNDEEKEIIGWTSLAKIDKGNQSAFFYGIVIGNPQYRKGLPWIEIQQYVMEYAFMKLGIHRLEYSCLAEHPSSMAIAPVMFFQCEGMFRQAAFKNDRFYDVAYFGILREEYIEHREKGEYELESIIGRYATIKKRK